MSNENSNNPNLDVLDEELVAYLDGELEPKAAQRVENLLAGDSEAQKRLNQLASSWDLLDQLPRATVDDLFTRTTVEMVALAAEDEMAKTVAEEPAKQRMRLLGGGIAALVAVVVGFVAVALSLPDHNDELLHDLRVVRDLEMYRAVGDINLLKQFQTSRMFTEDAPSTTASAGGPEKPAARPSNLSLSIPDSMESRRGWVEGLSAADKTELRREFEKFSALSASEQQSLRTLDAELHGAEQAEELRHIMLRYNEWLKTLQPSDRANLAEKSPEAKIEDIKSRQKQRALAWMSGPRGPGGGKSPDSVRPVFGWFPGYAINHEDQILGWLPEDLRKEANNLKKEASNKKQDDRGGRLGYAFWLAWQLCRPDSPVTTLPKMNEADTHGLQELISELPPALKDKLKELHDPDAQLNYLRDSVQTSLRNRPFGGQGGPFRGGGMRRPPIEEWTPEERAQLDSLTGNERIKKEAELFRQKHGVPDGRRRGGPPPGPPDDGPREPPPTGGESPHDPPPRENAPGA